MTGGNTSHYTTTDHAVQLLVNLTPVRTRLGQPKDRGGPALSADKSSHVTMPPVSMHCSWPRGPMDKASAYGAGDCRFESCRGHFISAEHTQIASRKHHMRSMMAAAIENSASTIREQNYKCRDPGSNRGPSDLQSDALPTELSRPCSTLATSQCDDAIVGVQPRHGLRVSSSATPVVFADRRAGATACHQAGTPPSALQDDECKATTQGSVQLLG